MQFQKHLLCTLPHYLVHSNKNHSILKYSVCDKENNNKISFTNCSSVHSEQICFGNVILILESSFVIGNWTPGNFCILPLPDFLPPKKKFNNFFDLAPQRRRCAHLSFGGEITEQMLFFSIEKGRAIGAPPFLFQPSEHHSWARRRGVKTCSKIISVVKFSGLSQINGVLKSVLFGTKSY